MTTIEIQDYLHLYSMLSFRDGKSAPGIVVNKYNVSTLQVEYYFIAHVDMQSYKSAFENYDRETCIRLSIKLNVEEVVRIRPVSLADYKIIMQLLDERQRLIKGEVKNSGLME